MRFGNLTIGVVAVASAFFIGRATALPTAQASVQPNAAFHHFLCYQVTVTPPESPTVQLIDQFQTFQTKLAPADLFCTPVKKKLIGISPLPVPAPADHLTCYPLQGPNPNMNRLIQNQVQPQGSQVFVGTPVRLCMPTHKVP
jgi:hypothetical protein